MSLGVVGRGQKASAALTLANRGSEPVSIERIETSCPCLTITPGSFRIAPGEKKRAAVEFDPSAEPEFRGGLAIDVTGYTAVGVAFQTLVKLEVRPQSQEEAGKRVPSANEEARP